MKRLFLILFAFLPFAAFAQNDAKAEQIVRGIVYKLKNNAYKGSFSMSYYSGESESFSVSKGELVMYGLKCRLSLDDNFILYDGLTHWAYSKDMNEVSVLEPSMDELKDINPLAMIESYISSYRIRFADEKGCISFIPDDVKSGIFFKIKLFYDDKNFPVKLAVYSRNGDISTFTWNEIKTIQPDNDLFVFDVDKFLDVEINDLR